MTLEKPSLATRLGFYVYARTGDLTFPTKYLVYDYYQVFFGRFNGLRNAAQLVRYF